MIPLGRGYHYPLGATGTNLEVIMTKTSLNIPIEGSGQGTKIKNMTNTCHEK